MRKKSYLTWEKDIPGREVIQCRGLQVRTCLTYLRIARRLKWLEQSELGRAAGNEVIEAG